MEHGSYRNPSASTFSITEEDHTLANSLRLVLNKDPRVTFCGYSIPHPSEARVNVRVQTTVKYGKEELLLILVVYSMPHRGFIIYSHLGVEHIFLGVYSERLPVGVLEGVLVDMDKASELLTKFAENRNQHQPVNP